jgi:hypothetical protein
MKHIGTLSAVALAGIIATGVVFAQAPQSTPTPRPAPSTSTSAPSQPSTVTKVESWTKKQWAAAQKEWSKDKAKWAECRKKSKDQKLSGRKSWSFLYDCMS